MVQITDLPGNWEGTIVRGTNTARVLVTFTVQDNAISGTYEMPAAPPGFQTGGFTGVLSDDILTVTLSETDSHGHLQLNLRVVESDGDYMIFGHTVVPTVFPGLATMTLYKSGFEYRAVSGAWIP